MIEKAIIKIKGKNYNIRRSWRSLIMFEEITHKNVDKMEGSATDLLILFYCIVKSNNKTFNKTYNEFLDMVDADDSCVDEFTAYIVKLAENEISEVDKKKV